MSFEIVGPGGDETVYAPLNTTIDADRDYRDLTGLDGCASCGDGMPRRMIPPGGCQCAGAGPCQCGRGLDGFYQDGQLTPGMLGEMEAAAEGSNKMLWVMGGLLGAWALWAWYTPHQEYG